jgi:hypothetical protein
MAQQTAVEWLENELDNILYLDLFHSEWKKVTKAIEQAKAMEKEQMIMFYRWMKEVDTYENAERFFHYTDEDMLNEYLKESHESE